MLSSPLVGNAPINSSQTEPMPIAASADDLVVLLDMMTKGGQAHPVDVKQWARLADITRKFGCDVLLQFIIRDLNENIPQHPWLVFCAASRLGDIKLATNAIKAMKDDKTLSVALQNTGCNQSHWSFTSPLSKMTQEYWQGCHGDYYFAFVKSVAQYEEEGVAGRYAWEAVANKLAGNLPKVGVSTKLTGADSQDPPPVDK